MEAFVGILVETLNSMIQKELGLLCGVATDMQRLSSLLSTTKAVLEDAEQEQFTKKEIQLWLQKLNGVAYEIDDVLDDYATEALGVKYKNSGCFSVMSYRLAGNLVFRHRIGRRMKEVLEKFNAITEEQKRLGLSDQRSGRNHFQVDPTPARETGSLLNEPDLVLGRDEEKEKIVEILVNQVDNNQNVSVLPIQGVGGLGKTTLAQMVFNDERVKEHFKPRLWAWVSEKFDLKGIIKALIESAKGGSSTGALPLTLDTLQSNLQALIRGRKYLVVLDDVWNDSEDKWKDLKSVLECGSESSSIITTTRMEKVAKIMGTLQTHYLSNLSDNQCWSVFSQRAFGPQEEENYPELVAIGKGIVKKCGGVPLAAKALGGFLRFKRKETGYWNSVKCSEIWNLPQDETGILPALKLSYLNLPVELRDCFAHCAVFPKGYIIDRAEVIHLWMANGLVSSKGMMEVEDVGGDVLTELHHRSLFQSEQEDKFGGVLTFKMHDLVHDLAQSVMKGKHGGIESDSTIRNLLVDWQNDQLIVAFPFTRMTGTDQYPSFLSRYGSLRTFARMTGTDQYSSFLSRYGSPRTSSAAAEWIRKFKELSPAISKLKHLRYLNLSGSDIVELPNSICDLWNLQILNLKKCSKLQSLPKGMRFLKNLQHLCLEYCWSLTYMPSGIGKLTCLRTLSMVILGGEEGFQLGELRDLNNLRGTLRIRQLERVKHKKDAEEANLIAKQSLRRLDLEWDLERRSQPYNDEGVLEALKPCPNLQVLDIRGFKGSSLFPSWISSVTNVTVWDSAAEYIINGAQESAAAATTTARSPSLKQLEFVGMPNLKGMLGREIQGATTAPEVFSQLQSLRLLYCRMLTLPLPCMRSLKELEVRSCPPNMPWASISNLTSLNSLEIERVEGLSHFPEEMLQNLSLLEYLTIRNMKDLRALPSRSLASLTALKKLSIKDCPELKSQPEEGLRGLASLQELRLIGCDNLVSLSMGTKALKSLTGLVIFGSNATALPEELKHVPALQKLEICKFPNLTSLPDWFGRDHLTSLQHLKLQTCPKLETLPSSIQMMAALQSLTIKGCELLGPQYQREGPEWHKIKHIPKVKIWEW